MRILSRAIPLTALLALLAAGPAALWSRPPRPQAAAPPLTLREYVSQLDRAEAMLSSEDSAAVRTYRAGLPAEWVVETPGGPPAHVKTDWLSAALAQQALSRDASRVTTQQARQRVAALRDAAQQALAPPPQPAQARAQLDRILAGREFSGAPAPSWYDQLKQRVQDWIWRQVEKLFGRLGRSATFGNILVWTMIIAAALLLGFWGVRALLAARSRAEMDLRGAPPAGRDALFWARQARSFAERGDYRGAVHAAYWASVLRLEELELLPQDRARTPRESLRLLSRGHAAYPPLAGLTRRFEIIWYGDRPAGRDDWTAAKQELEAVECLRSTPAIAA